MQMIANYNKGLISF